MDGWVRQCMHLTSPAAARDDAQAAARLHFSDDARPCALPSHAERRRPMGRLAVIWHTYTALFQLLNPAGRSSATLCNMSGCHRVPKGALMRQASSSVVAHWTRYSDHSASHRPTTQRPTSSADDSQKFG